MLYRLTFAQLKDEARHAIGGEVDSRTSLDRIVNGALEHLCLRHPWSWRQAITTLNFTAGQGQIELPEDYGELIDLVGFGAKFTAVRPAPLQDVVRLRVHAAFSSFVLLYHVGAGSQATSSDTPRRVLEVAPVPQSDLADALYLSYRRLIPVLSGENDVPAVPYGMFDLLRVLVRACAVSSTIAQAGHDWETFHRKLPDYIAADTAARGHHGHLTDQLQFDDGQYALRPFDRILMPGEE
jgi:hypothetical protein